jgi:hypothetical protein
MALERDLELLDDYLSNRLSGEERSAFEKRLESDPELKQELNIQQDFVQGIRNARVAELKSMLNNVPIVPAQGGQTSMLIKAGSWVAITGLVITGTFFYFSKDETQEIIQEPAPIEQPEEKSTPATTPAPETKSPEAEVVKPEIPVKEEEKHPEKESEKAAAPAVTKKPGLKVYDPSKEEVVDESKYEQEQLEIISKAFVTSSIEVETERTHKKYTFHYVFNNGKLILYGAFEEHLYEILEFISDDKRTVVLFYKTNYYLLDINKSTPTLLTPIKDRKLLKKLSEYGSN